MTINESEWVWLKHPDLERPARVHIDAAEAWRARGWVDVDPPVDASDVIGDPSLWGGTSAVDAQPTGDAGTGPAESTSRSRRSTGATRGE